MRKLVLAMFTSVDGYINLPGGELVTPAYSDDLRRKWIDPNLADFDLIIYGRACYQEMARFWTSPAAPAEVGAPLEAIPKLVLSRTLEGAEWGNARILRDDVAGEIGRLKQAPGKGMIVLGGAGAANSLLQLGLIDEMRLLVTPNLLGAGTRLFAGGYPRTGLKFVSADPFDSGSVLLHYRRVAVE
jgi:dihydrofolate reductase